MLLLYAQVCNASFYLKVLRYAFRHDCVILRRVGIVSICYKYNYLKAEIYLFISEV